MRLEIQRSYSTLSHFTKSIELGRGTFGRNYRLVDLTINIRNNIKKGAHDGRGDKSVY